MFKSMLGRPKIQGKKKLINVATGWQDTQQPKRWTWHSQREGTERINSEYSGMSSGNHPS